jgi:predicted nucleic acid-binding protein
MGFLLHFYLNYSLFPTFRNEPKEFCIVSDYEKLKEIICRDKNDNDIIALALSNNVGYLITGDNDLLVLKKYKNVKIISPRDFWVIVKGSNL